MNEHTSRPAVNKPIDLANVQTRRRVTDVRGAGRVVDWPQRRRTVVRASVRVGRNERAAVERGT